MSSSSTLPTSLFRYYPANLQTLENIKRQCFYFGGVGDFNDPFECRILPPEAKDSDESFRVLRDHYGKKAEFPEEIRRQVQEMDAKSFREMIRRSAIDMLVKARDDFIAQRGVTCFSERNENLLMWSHYASGGAGLCLEFDTANEVFRKAIKVAYTGAPPEVDALDVMLDVVTRREGTWVERMYCTKPIDWCYEQEWRVIHSKRGTVYFYPKECLKAVFFGPRCSTHFIETVCLILQGQNRGVSFWRGSMSHTKYAVEFEKFAYTAVVDAPKKA